MTLPKSLTNLLKQMPRIPLEKIRENVVTLRTEYEPGSLEELADSMEDQGQLQPVIVQQGEDDWFDLVIGSRRFRAVKAKGHRDVAAYVIDKREPVELLFIALAENLHRRDLNPFEEAQGFLRLIKEFCLDLKDIAKGVNKPENYVRGRLQLLSMPEEVVKMVAEQKLPINRVQSLARLPTGEDQVRLARIAVKHHLSQSELIAHVRKELEEPARTEQGSYELTSVKLNARLEGFAEWLQKVPRRTNVKKMNSEEKTSVLKKLQSLEHEIKVLLSIFGGNYSEYEMPTSNIRRNHREQWSNRDIKRIHARSRPSDEELALELGRTVTAIRAMRAQTKEPY